MKRLLIALSVLLSTQFAFAQSNAVLNALNGVEKAKTAVENPKKAAKAATWLKLGEAHVKVYEAPVSNVVLGMSQIETQMLLGGMTPSSSEEVILNGAAYRKDVYPEFNLYYDASGMLVIAEVTKLPYPDPLGEAVKAYMKAGELETKESGMEKVADGLSNVALKYFDEGMTMYNLGRFAEASDCFVNSMDISASKYIGKIDTLAIFDAGFTAALAGDTARAITMFTRCVEIGYYENGDVFARLADLYMGSGDKEKGKAFLEQGFKLYPSSQSIIVSLINYYLDSDEDPETLFALIAEAKANEPNNASLYYVEGDVYKGMGDVQKALECYYKSYEIDNTYMFGLFAAGALWYDEAVRVSEIAQKEMDDAKYNALVDEFEGYMLNAVEPFEKLFGATDDAEFKRAAAEYLKSIYFRFRDRDQKYADGYHKYEEYLNSLGQ